MPTFRRLLGFLRPYRRQLIFSLVLAWLAMGMTVLIPLLSGSAVIAIVSEHRSKILPLVLALLAAGIFRLGLTVGRRLIAGKVSLAVEFDLRQVFYEHLQKLELAFFDNQQTGQLMSGRPSTFSRSVLLGYVIWVSQSALTILFAAVAMFVLDPVLALIACAGAVPGGDGNALQPPKPASRAGGAAADRRSDGER
jgi:ATP-binding cassette subfamily B protein